MKFTEINTLLKNTFGADIIISEHQADGLMPFVVIKAENLVEVCRFLYTDPRTYFDYLACITGTDNGPENGTLDLIYNLYSIPFDATYCIKIVLDRTIANNTHPSIDTVCDIWRTANWHEREIYDLLGVYFNNHPDLRRILLPADWEGYPLRKDYNLQEYYREIKVAY